MIINHPVLNRFSPSIKEIAPQIDDDKLIIPNRFSLTGLPPEPVVRTIPGATNIQESSFFLEVTQSVVNGTAASIIAAVLRSGYWKLHFSVCYRSNFLSTLTGGDYRLQLDVLGGGYREIALFAVIGTQSVTRDVEMLVRDTLSITVFLDGNGVGQAHESITGVLCNKLI